MIDGRGPGQGAARGRRQGRGAAPKRSAGPRIVRHVHIDAIFRAIGSFCVRFRWLVLAVWVAGAIAAAALLPALSSVTQNNNTKFLPDSAPSQHAADLAAPFGTAGLLPIPVVAARSGAALTAADVTAVTNLRGQL